MNVIAENFADELRADPRWSAFADTFLAAFHADEAKAITDRNVRAVLKAVDWIIAQPRTIDEKMAALMRLREHQPGCHVLIPSMRKFLGWTE